MGPLPFHRQEMGFNPTGKVFEYPGKMIKKVPKTGKSNFLLKKKTGKRGTITPSKKVQFMEFGSA